MGQSKILVNNLKSNYQYSDKLECFASTAELRRPTKRQKVNHYSTVTLGYLHTRKGSLKSKHQKRIRILFDTGCSSTLINYKFVEKQKKKKLKSTTWNTKGGKFETTHKCKVKFMLPAFHENRDIEWNCYVDSTDGNLSRYDMIIGRDLLHELNMDFLFSSGLMVWDNASTPMVSPEQMDALYVEEFEQELQALHDPITTEAERIQSILDTKYSPANLDKMISENQLLDSEQKSELLKLLKKFEHLFDGTLGHWKTDPIDIKLKDPNSTPVHSKPYPVPHSQEQKLKEEIERLCQQGVMRKINRSEWAAPMFTISKPDGSIRSLADLRGLNELIKRHPFPIPKIQDLLQKLEGFMWATSLDLNMGYYHIELTPQAARKCTVVLPWGKYEYLRLPMGLCTAPDIFQEKMSELMSGLEFARAYLDDLLIVSKNSFEEHLVHIEKVLNRLSEAGLKINASKSFFCRAELEYLGYWITRDKIRPTTKKVSAILNIDIPKTRKQLRRFIGMINYYRDMWPQRSDILAPLTALTSSKVKFKWTKEHTHAFEQMKAMISRETALTYPDFSKPFEIHTDASLLQLGACISQDGRPVAFYSRKLNPAQTRYTTTERELLSIVETLKEFRTILLGQELIVHTDHENLTYKKFNSDRVMRWRLYIEEYAPNLRYIKGENNVVADALSRLDISPDAVPTEEALITEEMCSDWYCYGQDEQRYDTNPLSYQMLEKAQTLDPALMKILKMDNTLYHLHSFHGGGKTRELICYKEKIVIPKLLQRHVVDWYHTTLCHPGINRTEESIGQHLWWPNMRQQITDYVQSCPTCQRNKRKQKKYGLLPPKEAEAEPWDKMCIDLIGPYKINRKGKDPLICKCVTMIDPATGWFEIHQYDDKRSVTVANIAEQEWFSRYPWPTQVTFDRGSEFIGADFQKMIKEDYGVKGKPITVRNPQANAIVERVHQTIGNIIRTFELETNYLDEEDPWKGILSATAFAIRSTFHTTLRKSPGQLVFGRDMILNINHVANWEFIRERKQKLIDKNNQRENQKRIPHNYQLGDKVLLKRGTENKYEAPYKGPYHILKINDNGTVRLKVGAVTDTYNVRRLTPYTEPKPFNDGGECNMRVTRSKRRSNSTVT